MFLTPRLGIKACLVIIPLLGVTWLFGLLLPVHKAFAYIFTILNSTQVSVEWLLSNIIQSRLNFLTRRYNITIVTWYLLELWKEKTVKYARENRFLPQLWVTQFSFLLRFLFIHMKILKYICLVYLNIVKRNVYSVGFPDFRSTLHAKHSGKKRKLFIH